MIQDMNAILQGVIANKSCIRNKQQRKWICSAVQKIAADYRRSADTHLLKFNLSAFEDVDFYLKDESTHLTGSLKHRLARSLFLYALCNGHIFEGSTIVEASSGSTAISEAYFAQLLGLPFISVVPTGTSPEKLASIKHYGGSITFTESANIYNEAQRIATQTSGHYMDQFTYAERVTDWRGNNNIAESLFDQMLDEEHHVPTWVVVGAGTGGTSATIGRYIRYMSSKIGDTKLCVADPEGSVFFDVFTSSIDTPTLNTYETGVFKCTSTNIEGVGRPRHEPSFNPHIVDKMLKIDDSASVATAIWLESLLNKKFGGSTGLNVYAAIVLAHEMKQEKQSGSIVTLICDEGTRYLQSVHNAKWREEKNLNIAPYITLLQNLQ
ncbi:cysteine synthase A [Glaciecola punicea ACAM 611]|jgi:cysteine synthase A|uniref:Cysteine synthase A n=2 Tax=Glaciecola TaxID=89404 RepID=H5T8A4_9ALTE|nr:cysteine synthase [Glaciecola punicea]GAB54545.1 cysteine synthase A [Glaciecola punicea ACAM 611]